MSRLRAAGTPSGVALVAAFAAVYVIWGSTYLAIRIAIETLPPFFMAGLRFLAAGAMLYGWARLRGAAAPARAHWRSAAIVGTLLFLGGNGGVVWAEQRVSSGLAALMIATEPLWVVILGWAVRSGPRPSGRVVLGLVAGFAGVGLLVGAGGEGGGTLDPSGAAVLVAASACWAAGSLYSPRAAFPPSQVLSSAMTMLAGGVALLGAGLLHGDAAALGSVQVSPRSILAFGYLTVFGSIVAFSAYRWLLDVAAPARVATYAFVNPVVAVLLGWLVASEPVGARTLLAGAVIVLGVVLIVADPRARGSRGPVRLTPSGRPDLEAA
jgi:drug/metabolite transporter (DMT)-like permease